MRTHCLIIDDDNQEEYFNTHVLRILGAEGVEIVPVFVKPTDRKYLKSDHSGLDLDAIVSDCKNLIDTLDISIIVSDYKVATRKDPFTGVDIILALIETHPKIYKILYSATIKDAIKQILSLLPTKAKMEDTDINTVIRDLAKIAKINDFVSGKGYEQKVIEYFRNPEICYKQHLINVLKECAPDVIFKSCYPPFNGKTLKEIGIEIESDTPQGREFQEELIRQTLAYMVTINHE